MNILLITAARSWGGVKTWMLSLVEFLQNQGHNTAIICRKGDALTEECSKRQISCHTFRFGMDFSPISICKFFRMFKTNKTDVIITNISKELRTAGVAAKLKRIKHINRLGSYGDLKINIKTRLLYSLIVDSVFVCSQSLFDYFAQYGFLNTKLRMFHNAIEVPTLKITGNSTVKFAVVAKLGRRKQVDKVIRVFDRIRDLPWELHIGGFGPELENLKFLSNELNLDDRVHFTEEKIDPRVFLRDKDVGILYSNMEAFGFSIIEYMAMSCAVIASNVGGIPEIIENNIDGILVDADSADDLEQALRLLITEPELRKEFVQKGHEKVRTQFNRNTIFSSIENELQKLIGQ